MINLQMVSQSLYIEDFIVSFQLCLGIDGATKHLCIRVIVFHRLLFYYFMHLC